MTHNASLIPDTTTEAIRAFAARVRAALADLPESDVAELTDGLEESLAEQAADTAPGQALPHEGDAEAYADELRDAAGLPKTSAGGNSANPTPSFAATRQRLRDLRASTTRYVESRPALSGLAEFFVSLRPAWWVLRGWAVYKVIAFALTQAFFWNSGLSSLLPQRLAEWFVCGLAIVVSVQWGRGKWMPFAWMPTFRTFVSVGAVAVIVVAVPLMLERASSYAYNQVYDEGASYDTENGMIVNGTTVENIFPYDSEGNLLSDVQLFDQEGRPIVTVGWASETDALYSATTDGSEFALVPRPVGAGLHGWNIFPLRSMPGMNGEFSTDTSGALDVSKAMPATPPRITVYPLVALNEEVFESKGEGGPDATPVPTMTPVPTSVPAETPAP
ncbi:hypothetical protein [Lysinibacter cavernae]|uniref:Uncharacterized protein n=1 Tax=Lysinibacter cavernae TaxID=1640652 RepID=A0A7X5R313_9MICO|nr:hypothetical protein [Lysinibacter cavernae]NIH54750.1 hypothetical protein [Lysinibacter cavernae]